MAKLLIVDDEEKIRDEAKKVVAKVYEDLP